MSENNWISLFFWKRDTNVPYAFYNVLIRFISAATLSWSTSFSQLPSTFNDEPTINPSARFQYSAILSTSIPEPIRTGSVTAFLTSRRLLTEGISPVAVPVTITPSDKRILLPWQYRQSKHLKKLRAMNVSF